MLILKFISKLIQILRSGATPYQIAGGFALGLILGLTPAATMQWIIIFCLLILLNVNMASGFFSMAIFSLLAYWFDPFFHRFGYQILVGIPFLQSLWTTLYNIPVFPFTRFNNTVVMGSFITGLILFIPVFLLFKRGVIVYREKYDARLSNSKIMKAIKANPLIQWYFKVRNMTSGEVAP